MKKVLNWLFGDKFSKSDKIYYLGLSIIPIFGEDNKKFDIPYKLIRYGDERVNKDPESIEEYVNSVKEAREDLANSEYLNFVFGMAKWRREQLEDTRAIRQAVNRYGIYTIPGRSDPALSAFE